MNRSKETIRKMLEAGSHRHVTRGCPFCGGPVPRLLADDGSSECANCGARGPTRGSGYSWDSRAPFVETTKQEK